MAKESEVGLQWKPRIDFLSSFCNSSKNTKKGSGSDVKPQEEQSRFSTSLWMPREGLIDGLYVPPNDPKKLKKIRRKQLKDTAGSAWFDMPAPTITPELKKDLQLLKLRNVMDPKRHYKKGDSKSKAFPKYFQVGTVIESPTEYFSGRLTKKERKATLADELLSDHTLKDYRKRKVQEIEEQNRPAGNDKWKIKGRQSMRRAKQRRH